MSESFNTKYLAEHCLIDKIIDGYLNYPNDYRLKPSDVLISVGILGGEPAGRLLMALLQRIPVPLTRNRYGYLDDTEDIFLIELANTIGSRKPRLTEEEFIEWANESLARECNAITHCIDWLESRVNEFGMTDGIKFAIDQCIPSVFSARTDHDHDDCVMRLHRLRYGFETTLPPFQESWQIPFRVESLSACNAHASTLKSPRPTKQWIETAHSILAITPIEDLFSAFEQCIDQLHTLHWPIRKITAPHLAGLCTMLGLLNDPRVPKILGDILVTCASKTYNRLRSIKGFNACMYALTMSKRIDYLAELLRCYPKIATWSLAYDLRRRLERELEIYGLEYFDLEDIIVPTLDLDVNGCCRRNVENLVVRIYVRGRSVVNEWSWLGEPIKGKPKNLQGDAKKAVMKVTRLQKDMQAVVSERVDQIERFLFVDRTWTFEIWQERYWNHPLAGLFTKNLIWVLDNRLIRTAVIPLDDCLIDSQGKVVQVRSEETIVSLWRPQDHTAECIASWQTLLQQNMITQPFNQVGWESDCSLIKCCGRRSEYAIINPSLQRQPVA